MLLHRLAASTLRSFIRFTPCFSASRVDSIHYKILSSRQWENFTHIFNSEQEQITAEVLDASVKHISILLAKHRGLVSMLMMKQMMQLIEGANVEEMEPRIVLNYLSLMRLMVYKKFNLSEFKEIQRKLCDRYHETLLEQAMGQVQVTYILSAYFEMVFCDHDKCTNLISQHLYSMVNKQGNDRELMSISQYCYLLHILSRKKVLNINEIVVRSYALQCLQDRMEVLKMKELVDLAVSISNMEHFEMSNNDLHCIKVIGDKIIENMEEMEERQIFDLIRGTTSFQGTLRRVYHELTKLICSEIEVDGNCSIDRDTILSFFSYLGQHVEFHQLDKMQREKMMVFLKVSASILKETGKLEGIKNFEIKFTQILRHKFYNRRQVSELVSIVQELGTAPNFNTTRALLESGADVSPFLPELLKTWASSDQLVGLCRQSILLSSLSKSGRYEEFHEQVRARLSGVNELMANFYSPSAFYSEWRNLIKTVEHVNWQQLHTIYGKSFLEIECPLEETMSFKQLIYMEYVLNSYSNNEFKEFLHKNESKISATLTIKLMQRQQQVSNKSNWLYNNHLLTLVNSKVDAFIETKSRRPLYNLISFLDYYLRFAVYKQLDGLKEGTLFRILRKLLGEMPALAELKLERPFGNTLTRYLRARFGRYNLEQNYRDLILHVLKEHKHFKNLPVILRVVVFEGLRLNLITKQAASEIQEDTIKLMQPFLQMRLRYIVDNSYTPEITKLSAGVLKAVLSNHNMLPFITEHIAQIKDILQKRHTSEAAQNLASINLPLNKEIVGLITSLVRQLIEANSFDNLDLVGVINNMLERGYHRIGIYKELAEKLSEIGKKKMNELEINTHRQLVRLFVSQHDFNPTQYYETLFNHFKWNESDRVLSFIRLTGYEVEERYLQRIPHILKKDRINGLLAFLAYEQRIGQEKREAIVRQIAEDAGKSGKFFSELRYRYLERSYPQIMAEVARPEEFGSYSNTRTAPTNILTVLKQLAKENGESEEEIQRKTLDGNQYFRIKQWAIFFINTKFSGSINEHQFFKRALLQELEGEGVTNVIGMGNVGPVNLVKYLRAQAEGLVPDKFMSEKAEREDEEVVEEEKAEA